MRQWGLMFLKENGMTTSLRRRPSRRHMKSLRRLPPKELMPTNEEQKTSSEDLTTLEKSSPELKKERKPRRSPSSSRSPKLSKEPKPPKEKKPRAPRARMPRKISAAKKVCVRFLEPGDIIKVRTKKGMERFSFYRGDGFFSLSHSEEKNPDGTPKRTLRLGLFTPLKYNKEEGCFDVHFLNYKYNEEYEEETTEDSSPWGLERKHR